YPYVQIQVGGNEENEYQMIKEESRPACLTQSGGANADFVDICSKLKEQEKAIEEIENMVNESDEKFKRQDEDFYYNKNVVDFEALIQRNSYLIEMMNIVMVLKFMITFTNNEYEEFYNDLGDKMKNFRTV